MTETQLARSRKRLEQFWDDLLEPIGRRERRQWGLALEMIDQAHE